MFVLVPLFVLLAFLLLLLLLLLREFVRSSQTITQLGDINLNPFSAGEPTYKEVGVSVRGVAKTPVKYQ